jgi:hypothetical protein
MSGEAITASCPALARQDRWNEEKTMYSALAKLLKNLKTMLGAADGLIPKLYGWGHIIKNFGKVSSLAYFDGGKDLLKFINIAGNKPPSFSTSTKLI